MVDSPPPPPPPAEPAAAAGPSSPSSLAPTTPAPAPPTAEALSAAPPSPPAPAPAPAPAEAIADPAPPKVAPTPPPPPAVVPFAPSRSLASPKGILKRRRATAPEQATTDDPSVYMEGKRLRFRSMGDLGSDRATSGSPSPAPPSPFAGSRAGASARPEAAAAAAEEAEQDQDEGRDSLGRLPSNSADRAQLLVDINQDEKLREAVQRLDRFCEASVEWSVSLETQSNTAPTPGGSRLSRKHSRAGSPDASPRARPAQPRPFVSPNTLPAGARPSVSFSPKSASAQLQQEEQQQQQRHQPMADGPPSTAPMPPRSHSYPSSAFASFTDARRQSLPTTLQDAARSLVVMAYNPAPRSKSLSHGRASISASSNVLPPLSGPTSPPARRKSSVAAHGRRPSFAPRLPSFQDVVNNDGGGSGGAAAKAAGAAVGNANQLLHKFRRMSSTTVAAPAVAATAPAAAAAASSAAAAAANDAGAGGEPTDDTTAAAAGAGAHVSARSLVQTYSTVLRDRLHSWEGLEGLVKDAEAVADDWEEMGMARVESTIGAQPFHHPQPAFHQQPFQQPLQPPYQPPYQQNQQYLSPHHLSPRQQQPSYHPH